MCGIMKGVRLCVARLRVQIGIDLLKSTDGAGQGLLALGGVRGR